MQKKYLKRAALITLLIAGSYLLLWAAAPPTSAKDTCCESMEECIQKKDDSDIPGEMILGNFTRQFFSFGGATN